MVDRYHRIRTLGVGGQGHVWLARREADNLEYALKFMQPNPSSPNPQEDRARFIREIRCQTTLRHPHVAEIVTANTGDDPPWFVMPLAAGSLRTRLGSPLPETEAVDIFRQILSGVEYAHSEGVLHRDLKPENVLLINGRWVLSDFGLSRRLSSGSTTLTATNLGMGSIHYAAPEQWQDLHAVDERADIYALGKMLYELLSGATPWPSLDMTRVPPKYRWLITHATEQQPANRYSSVSALSAEFELLATGSSSLVVPIDHAKELLQRITTGDIAAADSLDRLLMENQDDEVLYKEFVVSLPLPALQQMGSRRPSGLDAVVHRFLELAEGSHPWSYTDRIADFLANAYAVVADLSIRRSILARLLVLGADHNRFYVGETFARLVAQSHDPSDIMAIAQVIRDHPESAPFNSHYLRQYSLPAQISAALDEVSAARAEQERDGDF